jgi:hypothetical protein
MTSVVMTAIWASCVKAMGRAKTIRAASSVRQGAREGLGDGDAAGLDAVMLAMGSIGCWVARHLGLVKVTFPFGRGIFHDRNDLPFYMRW